MHRIKEFIPPEYHKDKKEMEKKVFQEHRKLQGLSEINAKFRYVQLCRSLKTYGVTFFLVKVIAVLTLYFYKQFHRKKISRKISLNLFF